MENAESKEIVLSPELHKKSTALLEQRVALEAAAQSLYKAHLEFAAQVNAQTREFWDEVFAAYGLDLSQRWVADHSAGDHTVIRLARESE